jgi:hypothetical protein
MKKIHLIPVLLLGLSLSCKDSSQSLPTALVPSSPTEDYDIQMQEEAKNHPAINAPVIEQHRVKEIDGSSNGRSAISFSFDYYSDGKIKSVSSYNQNPAEYIYRDATLISNYDKKTYSLDNNGLAKSADDKNKFYYKDGYLVRTNNANGLKFLYSSTGNLTTATRGNESLNYFYTDYPNTIRQEILKLQEYSNTIRDTYLGRYSTNLIKEITYKGKPVATFEYEFDSQKRVTKVTMNRTPPSSVNVISDQFIFGSPAVIEYKLSY